MGRRKARITAAFAVLVATGAGAAPSPVAPSSPATPPSRAPSADADRALDILKASIAFPTVQGRHQVPAYAAYLEGLFRKAGFADVRFTPVGETGTLLLSWPGSDTSLKPLVVSDHMDVVEADPKDWTRDPFVPVVENGFVYGRGAYDNKFDLAMVATTLIAMKEQGYRPRRTIVLALSGDEETDMASTRALAPSLKNAELVLNGDGGGGVLGADGRPQVYGVQAGEKTYADFAISYVSPGGHSSRPGGSPNPIERVARAIDRIAAYRFPPQPNALTTAYLKATAAQTPGPLGDAMRRYAANPDDADAVRILSAEPEYVGQVRTTCVATMVQGGHALNALPQKATVSVNCRIMPGVPIAEVEAQLQRVVDDRMSEGPAARWTILGEPAASDASPLRADLMAAVRTAVDAHYPGVPVVPKMDVGASDSLYFRAEGVPSYGVSAMFMKPADDFSHGLNERAPIAEIPGALAQWRSLLTSLSSR